jgi:hypothetical protein
VGLFSKKATVCPICDSEISKAGNMSHWESHVTQIPEGEGDASGQFTWQCSCGPAGMKWPKTGGAMSGLALHMQQRHGIPLH